MPAAASLRNPVLIEMLQPCVTDHALARKCPALAMPCPGQKIQATLVSMLEWGSAGFDIQMHDADDLNREKLASS